MLIRNILFYHSAFFPIFAIVDLALYGTDGAAERLCIVGHHMTKVAEEEEVGIVWLNGNWCFWIAVAKQAHDVGVTHARPAFAVLRNLVIIYTLSFRIY